MRSSRGASVSLRRHRTATVDGLQYAMLHVAVLVCGLQLPWLSTAPAESSSFWRGKRVDVRPQSQTESKKKQASAEQSQAKEILYLQTGPNGQPIMAPKPNAKDAKM